MTGDTLRLRSESDRTFVQSIELALTQIRSALNAPHGNKGSVAEATAYTRIRAVEKGIELDADELKFEIRQSSRSGAGSAR